MVILKKISEQMLFLNHVTLNKYIFSNDVAFPIPPSYHVKQ